MTDTDRRAWLQATPKVELHLHLEGAIPLSALWQLVEKYGDVAVTSPELLSERFRYADFADFIRTWHWKNEFLREEDDFTFIATEVARALRDQNVVRCEAFFSPIDFARHGLTVGGLASALRRGLDAVAGIDVALICDLVRDTGPAAGERTLDALLDVATDAGVIGIGIGGSEAEFPPQLYTDVYAKAAETGLRRTAHAGEAAGAESVWGALEIGAERIGHGIRSVEDPTLVAHLAQERIPLEVCPLSNIATGVTPSIDRHPIRALFDAGVMVTINTDDPGMFGNSLTDDLDALMTRHGFSRADIRKVLENGVEAAWVSDVERSRLRAAFASFEAW